MKEEVFVGRMIDVCAELHKELERCGKISVGKWLSLRKVEKAEARQFGVSVEEIRKKS